MVLAGGQKACRQLRDNKRVLAQVTIALVRANEPISNIEARFLSHVQEQS